MEQQEDQHSSGGVRKVHQAQPEPVQRGRSAVCLAQGKGLFIEALLIDDKEVLTEAARWTTGHRGDTADPAVCAQADFTPFVRTAIAVGARILATTAESATVTALAGTVTQLAERAEAVSNHLVSNAKRAAGEAMEQTLSATQRATEQTEKVIESASRRVQSEMTRTVKSGVESVERELDRLLAGEKSPAAAAIRDVVTRAMGEAQIAWQSTLMTTLAEVGRSLDPSNAASPLGGLEKRIQKKQDDQHLVVIHSLAQVSEMVNALSSAAQTATAVAAVTQGSPGKGLPFDQAICAVAERVAVGLGATYVSTRDRVGTIKNAKKGDGVLEINTGGPGSPRPARVVLEFTASAEKRNWREYLALAERNRQAQASLGIVPRRTLVPGEEMLAVLAPNRLVMAFDPETDDPALFRSALQLLSVQAQRVLADSRTGDLGAVDHQLGEAKRHLIVMQELLKTAMTVQAGAGKVVAGLEGLHGSLVVCLEQAQTGLRDTSRSAA